MFVLNVAGGRTLKSSSVLCVLINSEELGNKVTITQQFSSYVTGMIHSVMGAKVCSYNTQKSEDRSSYLFSINFHVWLKS